MLQPLYGQHKRLQHTQHIQHSPVEGVQQQRGGQTLAVGLQRAAERAPLRQEGVATRDHGLGLLRRTLGTDRLSLWLPH